jgi:glycogen synthase
MLMRISVVCNTINRAKDLRVLLHALEYQTFQDFEVIVVNGPSTDDTAQVIAANAGRVRGETCPKANLSVSRNIGIAAAAGDVVAFIDDDGVPDPHWLEDIAREYAHADVGAVGGLVYDHTGYTLEYANVIVDRCARAEKFVAPPLTPYQLPKAEKFLHLVGCNCSFRRDVLRDMGGFDEEIEYFLDETEVCLQVNNRGLKIVQCERGIVLHKSSKSDVRCPQRIIRRPYPIVKNKYYFALQSARRGEVDISDAIASAKGTADYFRQEGHALQERGSFTPGENELYQKQIDQAESHGTLCGMRNERKSVVIPAAPTEKFLRYPTRSTVGPRLTVCFVSKDLPPEATGGVARYTHDLAWGLAKEGHEVHVVARAAEHATVDFEAGVWVHRVPPATDGPWRWEPEAAVRSVLEWSAAAHAEVRRIADSRSVDIVSCPSWDSEGLFCLLDNELPAAVTVVTTAQTVAETDPQFRQMSAAKPLIELERLMVRAAPRVIVPSRNMLAKVKRDFGPASGVEAASILPLGTPDQPAARRALTKKNERRVRVLTVGRIEARKGSDVFLEAAARLCPEFPNAEFILVGGGDRPLPETGLTYQQTFERDHGTKDWAGRVVFRGAVSEDELQAEYAACDIFCLPARFESFGLVLTEAMVYGKPTVAAAVGGMTDIVEEGRTGLLVYPGSASSLTAAMRTLLGDSEMRARMGRAGRERYEMLYEGKVVIRRTAALFERLAGRQAA